MPGTNTARQPVVHWFRADLRLDDNPGLAAAAATAKSQNRPLLPCFVFDPREFGATTEFGSVKTSGFRAQFVLECVADLRARLASAGHPLLVARGQPEDVLPTLSPAAIFCQTQITPEEKRVDRAIRRRLPAVSLTEVWGRTLYHIDDLLTQPTRMKNAFTPFRHEVEKKVGIRPALEPLGPGHAPALTAAEQAAVVAECSAAGATGSFDYLPELAELGATLPPPDDRRVITFVGGETAALARVQHYLFGTDALSTYFETRNQMLGADGSSKLSPWLAHGCVSPRRVAAECKRYEREVVENKSTYWLFFELLWRDFFQFLCIKAGSSIFTEEGMTGEPFPWKLDADHIRRWKAGTTGWPLVDANMREMAATGFMSNRGRQNVASFLALDLGIDWRVGADHFESLLVDYDVCSNWGNWAAAAGATGGRLNKFNIVKQSKDYDANGDYIRHWIPELANVPAPKIFQPSQMSFADKEKFGSTDYPDAIRTSGTTQGTGRSGGGKGGKGGGGRAGGSAGGGGGKRSDSKRKGNVKYQQRAESRADGNRRKRSGVAVGM